MSSTLRDGWRDLPASPSTGVGPVIWRGRQQTSTVPDAGPGEAAVPDDASLIEWSRVDAEAFGALYDRYCDRIYRYVRRRLRDHEAAEDVTADVFLKVLRAIDTYNPATAPFATWLYRIAANTVIDYARSRRITLSLDVTPDAADPGAAVDELVVNRVEAERVWQAIDALTEAQRTAVTLRYGSDLPIADIAWQMGRTVGAVKLLLNRGLTAVRTQLAAHAAEGRP